VGDLWKNQIEFLDALTAIRKEYPDARFALVASETGIGQIREFKDRAAALGLSDAVIWTGRLSKDEMMAFYRDIDIAVSTHRNEGFGIWALEPWPWANRLSSTMPAASGTPLRAPGRCCRGRRTRSHGSGDREDPCR